MKVLQINVWQGRLLRPLLAFIHAQSPDVIFAQEIFSYPSPIALNSPWQAFGTYELIAAQNGYNSPFFSPISTFTMFDQELGYGNAIFSKYEFSHQSTHVTGETGPVHYNEPSAYGGNASRNFQHAVVNTGRTQLNLINHHGHWVDQPLGDEVSAERLHLVANYINALSGPVLMAGDLNLSPDSPALQEFIRSTGLIDAGVGSSVNSTLSPAHYVANIICDFVLASPDLKITHSHIRDELISDHKAILTEIDC